MENNKSKTVEQSEALFEVLCEDLEKLTIKAQECYVIESQRFKQDNYAGHERLDFIEDILDIVEGLKYSNLKAKRVLERGKIKGFFK